MTRVNDDFMEEIKAFGHRVRKDLNLNSAKLNDSIRSHRQHENNTAANTTDVLKAIRDFNKKHPKMMKRLSK